MHGSRPDTAPPVQRFRYFRIDIRAPSGKTRFSLTRYGGNGCQVPASTQITLKHTRHTTWATTPSTWAAERTARPIHIDMYGILLVSSYGSQAVCFMAWPDHKLRPELHYILMILHTGMVIDGLSE